MKTCTKCGESKELSGFHKDRTTKSGYKPACKPCTYKRTRPDLRLTAYKGPKTCTKCGEVKDSLEFFCDKSTKDGLHPSCKGCFKTPSPARAESKSLAEQGLRKCSNCEFIKPSSEFYSNSSSDENSFHHNCKECSRRYTRENRVSRASEETIERQRLSSEGLKQCPRCSEVKPFSEFAKDDTRNNGVQSTCKLCVAEKLREYYASNEEVRKRRSEYGSTWKRENRHKVRSYASKRNALLKSVTVDDFSPNDILDYFGARGWTECVYCMGPFEHIDHFYPLNKGGAHSLTNLVPACAPCNTSKLDHNPYEWMERKGYQFTL